MNTRMSPGAAIVGVVFIVLGVMFLMDDQDVIRLRPMLVIPILLIALGLGVLAGMIRPEKQS
ncbi:MAG: hypothetical protein WBW04_23100 [Nitrolancea sp.]